MDTTPARSKGAPSQHRLANGGAVAAPAHSKVPCHGVASMKQWRKGAREGARSSQHHAVACVAAMISAVGGTPCVVASRSAGDGGGWPHPIRLGSNVDLVGKGDEEEKASQDERMGKRFKIRMGKEMDACEGPQDTCPARDTDGARLFTSGCF